MKIPLLSRYTQYNVVCKLLELAGIKVDIEGSDRMTPLHYAARYGKNETERTPQGTSLPLDGDGVLVVETLLKAKANINKKDLYELSPLHHASLRYLSRFKH